MQDDKTIAMCRQDASPTPEDHREVGAGNRPAAWNPSLDQDAEPSSLMGDEKPSSAYLTSYSQSAALGHTLQWLFCPVFNSFKRMEFSLNPDEGGNKGTGTLERLV